MWRVGAYADMKATQGASLKYCQVRVRKCESRSRIRVQFVYDESGRREQGRPRPSRGEVDRVQQQRREALTPCVGHDSSGDGKQRRD